MRYFSNIKLSHIDKTDKLNSFLSREGSPSSFILNLNNNLHFKLATIAKSEKFYSIDAKSDHTKLTWFPFSQ